MKIIQNIKKTYFDNEPNHIEQRKIFVLVFIYLFKFIFDNIVEPSKATIIGSIVVNSKTV